MKKFLRKIYYKMLEITPKKIVANIENIFTYGRFFKKDRTDYYGEKIQWLKLYGNLERYSKYVDKYAVREYIAKEIGEEYLIPLIGVYDSVNEIDYDKLPEQFVLKLNNGSGCNLIVKDKSKLDIKRTNKQLKRWLKLDYSKIKKEPQYKNVKNRIICEQYVADKNGNLLDYKYFCFDGKPEMIQVDFDRFGKHPKNFYDTKWNLLDLRSKYAGGTYAAYTGKFEAPKNHKKMQNIVEKLCEKFQFVRVDLYNVDGKIYFGELTFTPASGRHPFSPIEEDMRLASKIHINDSSKIKVLMVGPARDVKGGMTTVVDTYLSCGLNEAVDIEYIESINDKNLFKKILKEKEGVRRFKKVIKRYDIVHIHMASRRSTFRKIKYMKIAKKYNKKIVIQVHGGGFIKFFEGQKQFVQEKIVKRLNEADVIIALSGETERFLSGLISTKVVLYRNAIEVPKRIHNDNNNNNILFLGRIDEKKGIYDLIDAVKIVLDHGYSLCLYIAGSGKDDDELDRRIEKNNISKQVVRLGWISRDEKEKYLEKSSIFVLPSYSEAMPMSLLESMAYGCVPIVTTVGSMPEIVRDGVNGFVVEPKNPKKLAEAIEKVLVDKRGRSAVSKCARKTIESSFNIDDQIQDLINLYRGIV